MVNFRKYRILFKYLKVTSFFFNCSKPFCVTAISKSPASSNKSLKTNPELDKIQNSSLCFQNFPYLSPRIVYHYSYKKSRKPSAKADGF